MGRRDDRPLVLSTVCYDGVRIRTPWDPGHRFVLSAQCSQADRHREAVREHLAEAGIARLGVR